MIKFFDEVIKKQWFPYILVGLAIAIGVGVRFVWPKLKPDNAIEEVCEKVIYKQTGVDVDLSPSSKE